MISDIWNNLSVKYQRFKPSGCNNMDIRTCENWLSVIISHNAVLLWLVKTKNMYTVRKHKYFTGTNLVDTVYVTEPD